MNIIFTFKNIHHFIIIIMINNQYKLSKTVYEHTSFLKKNLKFKIDCGLLIG
jgi:hypothetical protein